MEFKIYRHEQVVSTNAELKSMDVSVGTVVVAASQTNGYGRGGREFCSPTKGLYMSVLLGAETISDKLFVPIRAAVAVHNALSKYVPCGIKWPNDIVTDRKKVCGVLAESSKNNIILGIGVNVNTPDEYFRKHDLHYATSLFAQTNKLFNLDDVLNDILNELNVEVDKCKVIGLYRQNCLTLGKEIRVIQGNSEYVAKALDLTENGELIVQKDGQIKIINSGEVSIRGSEYV